MNRGEKRGKTNFTVNREPPKDFETKIKDSQKERFKAGGGMEMRGYTSAWIGESRLYESRRTG